MARRLILVRHPPVALAWQKRCYGHSDPGLSRAGQAMVAPLVRELATLCPEHVLHSGMRRTLAIADPLARQLGIAPICAPAWRERDFGSWEGQGWNAIYRATRNAMDGMIDAPETFRPGDNGETTRALVDRIEGALSNLPRSGTSVVVCHGGAIAAARMLIEDRTIGEISELVIPAGSIHLLELTVRS